ncbi:TRAP transporter substrate-binding protein [uncultured Sphaerochaeta sp.]|uniref:TRAP transporter substrate-binding protein n=1 Tax=uncultured Sphaerochaeta sp. TaxID=886478 RepID=UPI002A0A6824|nr:TRAP transporter substrate-binding protein [uncultured Sphaerochaeta sp.]
MKKVLVLVLAVAIAATAFVSCSKKAVEKTVTASAPAVGATTANTAPAPVAKKSYTFKYAELNPNGHIMDLCGDKFAELVAAKSNGRITIEVFPAGQLGDEKTMYQTLQMGGGAIDICRGNTNSLGDFGVKKLTLFGLPFIFRDRAHLWSVLNSEIGKEFLNEPQEIGTGMVGLSYLDEGSRNFFLKKNITINSIADFKGLKLRVPTTALMTETVSALGVQSTPISFSELYSALQAGTVDGAEQPHSGYYSNKFYEVAPNYILTGHTYSPSIILMSENAFNKLDADDQAIIREAATETAEWNRASIEKLDTELLQKIKDAGANVVEVKDKTPYINATKDVVIKYAKGLENYYEAILAK